MSVQELSVRQERDQRVYNLLQEHGQGDPSALALAWSLVGRKTRGRVAATMMTSLLPSNNRVRHPTSHLGLYRGGGQDLAVVPSPLDHPPRPGPSQPASIWTESGGLDVWSSHWYRAVRKAPRMLHESVYSPSLRWRQSTQTECWEARR
ncbi:hypothetical protein B0T16DRAFT_167906 [Cercophora newfieldiana]|uniref:Uncharacterized protein n=1 Tax=Cercophora newfieldiana TaxID=92897 RepID=A0AA40CRC9_9PEZI|nr:hypothetical protein B0T16DRAFT_167906 [Cercophora newfieldiana]